MKKKVLSDEEIRALVEKLQSPEALAEAEKPVRAELVKAAKRHAEILRRSREAPIRVCR